MVKVQHLKNKSKVSFKLDKNDTDATKVSVVGDFNDWNPNSNPMKKLAKGGFSAQIDLDKGKTYQFRYFANDNEWFNDSEADTVPNEYGGLNSVVSTVE